MIAARTRPKHVAKCCCVAAITALLAKPVGAAPPVVEYFFPAGGQQGTTFTIATGSKSGAEIKPWPARVWTDTAELELTPDKPPGAFSVHIAADAPLGPHLIRFYNEDGAAAPRLFVVGRHPELAEKEPNDDFRKPQMIKNLPVVVNGRLDKPGDVDCYGIDLKPGQWLLAEVEGRRLGSLIDPSLRLVDESGVEVAFNEDTYGLDPLIAFRAPKAGRYVLQLHGFAYPPGSNVEFAGSGAGVYRLNVTTGPYARFAFPACVTRDRKSTLQLFGWNLEPTKNDEPFSVGVPFEFEPAALRDIEGQAFLAPPAADNVFALPVVVTSAAPQAADNNAPQRAQPVSAPAAISGRIAQRGECRFFSFDAKAKESLVFTVQARFLNSPLEPMLVITDSTGKELSREVGAGQDIHLDWTCLASGTFTASLTDLAHNGGGEYHYLFGLSRPAPDFSARVEASAFSIAPGKSSKIEIAVTRLGNPGPLKVEAVDLPEGITATAVDVPAKGPAILTLTAAATAIGVNHPFHIRVHTEGGAQAIVHPALFSLTPEQFISATHELWLTIPPSAKNVEPKKESAP